MDTAHQVTKTKGPFDGKFTFTSHIAGDHAICLSTNYTSWFSGQHIRLYLDVLVGHTKADSEHDRSHVSDVASAVRDLNQKLDDIRREQQYQREREADYRNLSESTNSKAVWYSVLQITVLLGTCFWQMNALKVSPLWYELGTVSHKRAELLRGSETKVASTWLCIYTSLLELPPLFHVFVYCAVLPPVDIIVRTIPDVSKDTGRLETRALVKVFRAPVLEQHGLLTRFNTWNPCGTQNSPRCVALPQSNDPETLTSRQSIGS